MAVEKIAEMFAELGFKVDTKGLKDFEKHLSKLKEDFAGVKSSTIKMSDATVKADQKIKQSSRNTTNSIIRDRKRLKKALTSTVPTMDAIHSQLGISRDKTPSSLANKLRQEEAKAKRAYERKLFTGKAKHSSQGLDSLLGINRGKSDLAKDYAKQEQAQARYNKKLFSGKVHTKVQSIDSLLGISRDKTPSSLAGHYAKLERQQEVKATKEATKAANKHKMALDGVLKKMNPLQYEYEQLKRSQDMLNKEMSEGTTDAKRYEAALGRIQSRMAHLDNLRGRDGSLPFREARGAVGRPSSSFLAGAAGAGAGGLRGLIPGIGLAYGAMKATGMQVQTEQTAAKMGMVLSEDEAKRQLKFASDNARALGVNAIAAASGYADLMVQSTRMGVPLEDTQNLFMGVSEASVAMGLSVDQQKGIYKAFSDMLAKGTVQAEELNLLAPFHSDVIGLAA